MAAVTWSVYGSYLVIVVLIVLAPGPDTMVMLKNALSGGFRGGLLASLGIFAGNAVQGSAVFVVDGGRVRKRTVTIGIRGTRAVEVLDGLKEGERIASPATAALADGVRVRVQAAP